MTIVASADCYSAVSDTRTCNAWPGVGLRSRCKDVQAAFLHSRTLYPAVDEVSSTSRWRRCCRRASGRITNTMRHSTLPANTASVKNVLHVGS